MNKKDLQISALEMLKKLIAANPEKVSGIINKHINSNIEGPTFEEYLSSINETSVISDVEEEEYIKTDLVFEEDGSFVITTTIQNPICDPPPLHNKRKLKKDSVDSTESFFLLLLQNVRSKTRRVQV